MATCPECQTALVVEGIAPGQQVSCIKCHALFRAGEQTKTSADRLAWRSFWLGLSSIVLLFITGLPAIYYGVRSLLRMRYVKSEKRDRVAAITGTVLGGCFGLLLSFALICIGVIIAFALLTIEKKSKPDEVAALFARVFDSQMPDGLIPIRGVAVLQSQYFFDFADADKREDRTLLLHLVCHNALFQAPVNQTIQHLRDHELPGRKVTELRSEMLKWKLADREIDVKKIEFEIIEDEFADPINPAHPSTVGQTIVQYYGYSRSEIGTTGFSIVVQQPQPVFDEARLKELVASIKPGG